MKFDIKYKIVLFKKYFDTGYGMTNYFKYFVLFFGLYNVSGTEQNWLAAAIGAIAYALFCFVAGYFWLKYRWFTAELEVNNQFNLFQQEVRKEMKRIFGNSVNRKA